MHKTPRRALLTGALAGGLGLTACTTLRLAGQQSSPSHPAAPSPAASSAAPEQSTDEDIRRTVLARLAAEGLHSINVDVNAHGHGGAHVFIDGSVATAAQLLGGLKVGYQAAIEHTDYAVIATLTRPPHGGVGRRAVNVTWGLDDNSEIAPRPKRLASWTRQVHALFSKASEDVEFQVSADLDEVSGSVLITGMTTSTTAVADTYRRLRPAWRPPAGVTRTGFAVGSSALFVSDDAVDVTRHRSALVPDPVLSAWARHFGPRDDTMLTIVTHADGEQIVKVTFTASDASGLSAAPLARALIDAHGDSSADLVITGTTGHDTIDFDAQYCEKAGSRSTRAAYAYYVKRHPKAAERYHLGECSR